MARKRAKAAEPEAPPEKAAGERPPLRPLRLLGESLRNWGRDDCDLRAAAIAYYALLSFFPFLILLASVATVFVGDQADEVRRALRPLRPVLPDLDAAFWDRVQDLLDKRGVLSAFSLALLFVVATRVTVCVEAALVAIFHARSGRSGPQRTFTGSLLAHGMTLAALLALGLVLTSVALLEILAKAGGSPAWLRDALDSAWFSRHAVPFALLAGLGYALFELMPRLRIRRRHKLAGALFFALSHDLTVSAWARLTAYLSPRDVVYGSFVGIISFATWTWVASSLLLLSAELVAELRGKGP